MSAEHSLTHDIAPTATFIEKYGATSDTESFRLKVELNTSKRLGLDTYTSPSYLGLLDLLARSVAMHGFPTLITFFQHKKNALRQQVWKNELGAYWTSPMLVGYLGSISERYIKMRATRRRIFKAMFGNEPTGNVDVSNQDHCNALFLLPRFTHESGVTQTAIEMYQSLKNLDDPFLLAEFLRYINSDLFNVLRVPDNQVVRDWTFPQVDSKSPAFWDDRTDAFLVEFNLAWRKIIEEMNAFPEGLLHLLPVKEQIALLTSYTDKVLLKFFPHLSSNELTSTHEQTATWFEQNKQEPKPWQYD